MEMNKSKHCKYELKYQTYPLFQRARRPFSFLQTKHTAMSYLTHFFPLSVLYESLQSYHNHARKEEMVLRIPCGTPRSYRYSFMYN